MTYRCHLFLYTILLEFAKEIMLKLKVENEEKIQDWYEFHKKGFYKDI